MSDTAVGAGGPGPSAQWPRRVLWHSVVPWAASAYAGQTRLITRGLRDRGVDVHMTAAAGLSDDTVVWDGIPVHPAPSEVPGVLGQWARHLLDPDQGDRLVTFVDPWRLEGQALTGFPTLSWTAIETEPASPRALEALRTQGVRPVAVSAFVRDQLAVGGFASVPVVRHGIDTAIFRPSRAGDRSESKRQARRELAIDPSRYVVGMVVSNGQALINRKSLPEVALAFAAFAAERPEAMLVIHSTVQDQSAGGLDLRLLLSGCGLRESQFLLLPAQPSRGAPSDQAMACLYNALDVLCQPSGGEGFCLPLVEAQACGVPVIASNFSAQPEQTGAGWLVGGQRRWLPSLEAEMFTPSIAELSAVLVLAHEAGDSLFEPAVTFARRYESSRILVDEWQDLLQSESTTASGSDGAVSPSSVGSDR